MTITIRHARKTDYTQCVALLQKLRGAGGEGRSFDCADAFAELITDARGRILVAEDMAEGIAKEGDGADVPKLVGMATVSYNLALRYRGEYCQLEELIVSPEARGRNVGGLLVSQTVKEAKDRGCREFGLYLVDSTEHNRPFYEKYGFKVVGTEMRQAL